MQELRGFGVVGDLLYVVNAYKKYSQILVYEAGGAGDYSFKEIFASKDTINSILHPYDLTFDPQGHCYVSSQDTNVVTGLKGADSPLQIASYLQLHIRPRISSWRGPLSPPQLGRCPAYRRRRRRMFYTQGLEVSFTDDKDTRVANSVRGVLFFDDYLFVADEPANAVKVYDRKTGELYGQIAGDNLRPPVQLLLTATTGVLYISSSGNDSVVSYDLSQGAPSGTVPPTTFIDGEVKHISGMAFDAEGYFYAAERKAKRIKKFPPAMEAGAGMDFIRDLPDEPELIMYVPKIND